MASKHVLKDNHTTLRHYDKMFTILILNLRRLLFKECPTSLSRTQVSCTVSHVPGSRLFSLPCRPRSSSSAQIVVAPRKESAFFVSPISL